MSAEVDGIVEAYFRRLDELLAGLPASEREPLLAEIRSHVSEARAGLAVESPAAMRDLLDRVGRPEEIAAEALGTEAARVGRRPSRRLVFACLAVAVVVAAGASVVGVVVSGSSGVTKVAVAPTAGVGGFPTGIASDPQTETSYVSSGISSVLSIIDDGRCNASTQTGCVDPKSVSTGGQDAIGVAVDEQTHTVYAVNGGSDSVAVIDERSCDASVTSGCAKPPAQVEVPGAPQFLALNEETDTLYVADTNGGSVSVINGKTCNATDTSGCKRAPASVTVGIGAFPIAVDEATNTIYVGTGGGITGGGTVYVIDGNRCDSMTTSGCSAAPKTVAVGSGPAGIAVDASTDTVYVSSEDGTVTVFSGKTCNGADQSGCSKRAATVTVGLDARGDLLDDSTHTLYVTNAGSNSVSLINTSSCNADATAGCSANPTTFPVGASPRRLALDETTHTLYVVNSLGNSISMIDTRHCNAADTRGCPTQPSAQAAATGQPGIANVPVQDSSCSPTTAAGSSGGPSASLTGRARQVASGRVAGQSWSLWSAKGQSGANGIEDGGLVVGGHAYGLCAGYPNPAELELLDLGGRGVVYGVIGYPKLAKVNLSVGTVGTFEQGTALPAPQVQVVNGVSFFIETLPKSACAYKALELDSTSPGVSAEHNLGFGACTANKLSPITFSQGIWQLQPGKFVNNFPGSIRSPGIANVPLQDSSCSPTTAAGSSGGPAASLTSRARQVASGTVAGQSWSLWSAKGQSGANGLEDGGLVVNGHAYGLCPGYRNPAELELLALGGHGVVYGVIGYPKLAKVNLSVGTVGTFEQRKALPAPQVQVVNGVSFFIGTLPKSACAYKAIELDSTSPGVSAEHNLGFGACAANKLSPITFSQGIWQLPAGKFVNNFGAGPSIAANPGTGLTTTFENCGTRATTNASGEPAVSLRRSLKQVANGTIDGHIWSLWANTSAAGVNGIEQGRLVLDGRWYGLCVGPPNPAEFELVDSKPIGILYGYIANPGPYAISLNTSDRVRPANIRRVHGGTFFITALARSACKYSAIQLNATTASVNDLRYQSFGTCQPNQLVTITGGHGSW